MSVVKYIFFFHSSGEFYFWFAIIIFLLLHVLGQGLKKRLTEFEYSTESRLLIPSRSQNASARSLSRDIHIDPLYLFSIHFRASACIV